MRALVFDRVQLAVHVEDDHGAPVMPHQRSLACLGDLLGFQSQWCHGTALNSGEMNGVSLLTPEFECECEAPRVDAVPVDSPTGFREPGPWPRLLHATLGRGVLAQHRLA